MVDAPRAANDAPSGNRVDLGALCPGWHTERVGERLLARRLHAPSDYQVECGCLEEIAATSVGELVILCEAQTLLAERVLSAEAIARPRAR
ncbi:hypothetical protein [Actinomadura harenae]|uniref:Uncharacterized protein n=1 Tax=Actinomadura harenae TaxID=2483351 RepID=A0A3M2L991_9ACTN|nr:hypothetical protein [Actinomadura harenae]RMI32485.1 hypothetical protein EBO15_41995 [Actinomadura harenae]